jgi:7,8-dihydropterin-6-yl-methyl-4-(beta-D-ribofuranosyl)aminobenzene 5'-phosphate synthase
MEQKCWNVTILVHNYARGRALYAEHGLSLLLEPPGRTGTVLYDTGQSGEILLHNAKQLGVDLDLAATVVLSHGHYDHTGGLPTLVKGRTRRLIAHPQAFDEKLKGKEQPKSIGSPVTEQELTRQGWTVDLPRQSVEVVPQLLTTGEVPRLHQYEEEAVAGFYTRSPEGAVVPDTIPDDLSLIITIPNEGFFLLCGCCHAGLINTLEHAKQVTGQDRILGVLGGLHTIGASEERLEKTFEALEKLRPEALYPLHCAGERESILMEQRFPDRTKILTVGERLQIPVGQS